MMKPATSFSFHDPKVVNKAAKKGWPKGTVIITPFLLFCFTTIYFYLCRLKRKKVIQRVDVLLHKSKDVIDNKSLKPFLDFSLKI